MSASVHTASFAALGKNWTDLPAKKKASLGNEKDVEQGENITEILVEKSESRIQVRKSTSGTT